MTRKRATMESRKARPAPPQRMIPLYHYTSAEGLEGILAGRALWASHVGFLNDLSEGSHAVELAREVCEGLRSAARGAKRDLLGALLRRLGRYDRAPFFVASFSEASDQLGQWRAYCPYPGGYSIGFDKEDLERVAKFQGFTLNRCEYAPIRQRTKLAAIIQHHVLRLERKMIREALLAASAGGSDDPVDDLLVDVMRALAQAAPFMKHPTFSEEREWRLVSPPILQTDLNVRAHRGRLLPYVAFDLEADPKRGALPVEVFVGPSAFPARARQSVSMLLLSRKSGAIVRTTSVPYAVW